MNEGNVVELVHGSGGGDFPATAVVLANANVAAMVTMNVVKTEWFFIEDLPAAEQRPQR
jgi:hypothetical protein